MIKNVTRRSFLRTAAVAGAGLVVAACQPKVVEVTKIVEKEVEKVVKETVIVEGTPKVVEKVVKETVVQKVVEKEQSDLMAKADDSAIVSAAGSGKIVLEFWNGLTGEDGITMIKICQQFTEKNPEVTIKTQRIPWGNYFDKLLPAIVAGSGPDLFILHRGELHEWKPKNVLAQLDDLFETGVLQKDDFNKVIYEDVLKDGHVMGLPIDAYGPVLWLNLGLLEKAGIKYDVAKEPMKRDEFLQVATALTFDKSGKHPGESGFDPKNVDTWGYADIGVYGTVANQNGVDSVSTDGSCQAMVTDERYIDAITFCRDLRWKYYVQSSGDYDAAQAMGAGKLAMFYNGSWFYNWFRDFSNMKWGVWYLSQYGANKGVWNDSHCLTIHKDLKGDKLDWVKKLMPYISSSHLWAAEAGMPTPRKSVAQHPQIAENWALPMQLKQQDWIIPANRSYPCGTEVSGVLGPEVAAVINNEKEPLKAMQDAAARMQPILDRCCKK